MKYHPSLWGYIKEEYVDMWHTIWNCFDLDKSTITGHDFWTGTLYFFCVTVGIPVVMLILVWSWFEFRKLYTDEFINKL